MDYAIVRISGKQYQVTEGQEVTVEHLGPQTPSPCDFSEILLIRKNGTVHIGDPFVKDAVVRAQILAHVKGKKMYVSKFKAKVNYNKTIGFRPMLTQLKIDTISYGNTPEKPAKQEKPKAAPVAKKVVKKTDARKSVPVKT